MSRTRKRSNNHHLVWPRTQQSGIRKIARSLPCLQVMLDIEVHRILHQMYGVPKPMPLEDAQWLIQRHRERVCACFDPTASEITNILAINRSREEDYLDEASA